MQNRCFRDVWNGLEESNKRGGNKEWEKNDDTESIDDTRVMSFQIINLISSFCIVIINTHYILGQIFFNLTKAEKMIWL